jgi:S1-C subfamily serine protease
MGQSVAERESARIDTIARIAPSVVCVMAPNGEGGGSGVLISADGFAISNYHVTSGSGSFMKSGLNDGKLYDSVIVGIDPTGDVALIQLQGRTDFEFAQPGNSDAVRAGDEVMALGNPFLLASDFTPTVTYGIVSGVRRYQYPANTFLEYTDCIQIDASINPGNSGGPLFDIDGRWIGINGRASFEKRGRVNSGAAYAISVNQVKLFIEHLKCGLIVDHGVTEFTVETQDGEVVVSQVSELSEAWRRGLRPRAKIVSFAGRIVTSANDFQNVVGIFPEGTRLPLSWRDQNGLHNATIRLRPLHAFQKAPELPEERQQKPEDNPHGPDEKPADHSQPEALPESLTSLFVARDGFCNYHFNEVQQNRLLGPFRDRVGTLGNPAVAWQISLASSGTDQTLTGELAIGPKGAGLKLNGVPYLQDFAEPTPEEEPAQLPGLLTAMLQLRRLLGGEKAAFTEQLAMGRTLHLPLNKAVDVLVTREGVRTCRWYFSEGSPLPVGMDLEYAQGQDEVRLLLEDWADRGGAIFPGRIGMVVGEKEELRWLTTGDVTVK